MAEIKQLICDVCGKPDATGYGVRKRPGAEWIIDLCEGCAAPIVAMQAKGRAPVGKKRPYRKYGVKVETTETRTVTHEAGSDEEDTEGAAKVPHDTP